MHLDFSGKTALVTGASAGIGREIARLLAEEVATLVLVARRRGPLDELATELTAARPGLRVLVRAVDLVDGDATGAMLDALARDGVHVDVLINNAGFGDYDKFHKSSWPKLSQMLSLNVTSATYLLHRLVPGMIERGFGAILNVGSVAGVVSSPMMAVYSATKAYLNLLGEGLRTELAGTGVSLTTLCPGPVPTEFQRVAQMRRPLPELLNVDAVTCARAGLDGLKRGRARVVPGLPARAMVLAVEATPKALLRPILTRAAGAITREQ